MPISKTCPHINLSIEANVTALFQVVTSNEPDHRVLQVTVKCVECGMPFEFVGLQRVGMPDPEMAAVNPTGLVACLPIRPGFTNLFAGVSIGMPPKALK